VVLKALYDGVLMVLASWGRGQRWLLTCRSIYGGSYSVTVTDGMDRSSILCAK
jgi:hypothetical protein